MSEMKDRVAQALRKQLQNIGYGGVTINAEQISDALARAAIEAMREPTDEMVSAVNSHWGTALETDWQDMIDAALKPAPVDA